jgi:D-arabinose 1-dehydrogenase-like Zn-dependent alcohol dehydrogenase
MSNRCQQTRGLIISSCTPRSIPIGQSKTFELFYRPWLNSVRYLDIVNPFGKVYPLEIDFSDLVIPFAPFLLKELQLIGECSKTPTEMNQMLKFAAENGIAPIVQEFPFNEEGAEKAIKALQDGTMRYRGVLVM